MNVKLLTEQLLEFLRLIKGCTGSYESTPVKIPHYWKSHAVAHLFKAHQPISQRGKRVRTSILI